MTLRAAVRQLFWGPGVFAERLQAARDAYGDDPLAAEVIEFASVPSKRGLIRSGALADE
jgi:hypothetical protein